MPDQNVTQLLNKLSAGNQTVVNALLPRVYDELHNLANRQLHRERDNHTLNATALVHEAYLNLVQQRDANWQNRSHFMGIAALAMRRILVNYAKARLAEKRGGGAAMATFNDELVVREARAEELVALDEALAKLEQLDERQAKVVTLRYFGGLSQEEIAAVLDISVPTVGRDWRFAKAWLAKELGENDE
jgi:RNA polymerase sigma factor (TIGR02999 family)